MPTRRQRRGGGMFDWFTGKKDEKTGAVQTVPVSPPSYLPDAMNAANPVGGRSRRRSRRSRRSRIRKRR